MSRLNAERLGVNQEPSTPTVSMPQRLLTPVTPVKGQKPRTPDSQEASIVRRPATRRHRRPTRAPGRYYLRSSSGVGPPQEQEQEDDDAEEEIADDDKEPQRETSTITATSDYGAQKPSLRIRIKWGKDKKPTLDRLDVDGRPLPKLRKIWDMEREQQEKESAAAAAASAPLFLPRGTPLKKKVPSLLAVVPALTTPRRRLFADVLAERKRKRDELELELQSESETETETE
ncbi:hypothetical protein QBC45DRAFT_462445 [Copromyces sp. CBS 386.78]|nr:hypothetical protein QBC45DRAFT_462445 [Copromyces sp. CBS 386.78]